ncbi:MAG: hypothetical protein ACRD8Z_12455 [Nitrososphaeraceae archaeon]
MNCISSLLNTRDFQNLLNLISDNTNILEGIKQIDAFNSAEDEGKAVLRLS